MGPQIGVLSKGLDELLDVHCKVFNTTPGLFRDELKKRFKDPRSIIIGARNGSLAGYCVGAPLSAYRDEDLVNSYSIYPFDETLYIRFVGCLPEHRGKGLATQMLQACFEEGMRKGYSFGAGHFSDGASHSAAKKVITPEIENRLIYGNPARPFIYLLGTISSSQQSTQSP